MKKSVFFAVVAVFFLVHFCLRGASANEIQDNPCLSLSGLVRFPIHFTLSTLADFPQRKIRVTEVKSDTTIPEDRWYQTYWYYGVPLSQLLEMAHVWKQDVDFKRLMDLAVIVRGKEGRTVLSWPEVCNTDASGIMIALRSEPVPPLTKKALNQEIFPRLVFCDDFYADRFVDGVFNIEVVSPSPPRPFNKGKHVVTPQMTITGDIPEPVVIKDLSRYGKTKVISKQSGHDTGYFGVVTYSGAALLEILDKEGIKLDSNTVIIATSSEGYRACISYGELALSPGGERIILADRSKGKTLGEFGKFNLIFPDDFNADRWVKTVDSLEIIRSFTTPRIYIVGVGSGDSDLLTLEGLSVFGKAQAFVCDQELEKRFRRYMGNKPVLYNPLQNMPPYYMKTHFGVSMDKAEEIVSKLRQESVAKMKSALGQGKDIAFLEYGDPTIFGSWTYWLHDYFGPEEITVVPGVSAFNAANAMLGKNVVVNGAAVLTCPEGIMGNQGMLEAVAARGDTLCIFMGIQELPDLLPLLKDAFGENTPACLVYKAGYSNNEKLIRTHLGGLQEAAQSEREKFLGVVYVGQSLK